MLSFASRFGRPANAAASAPGRVNLIGEHTDYNGGYVLPLALPLRTTAELALRTDDRVRACSANRPDADAVAEFVRGREQRTGGWIDYVQGVTQALAEQGHVVPGFDLAIHSDVPTGSGLASSAALEVAVLRALRLACALEIDDVQVARVAHRAETGLVGAPVGIMDQMVASVGGDEEALFIDTRTLGYERVRLPDGIAVAIVDSGLTHGHASGEYRVRRAECAEAARHLGVEWLSDVSRRDLPRVALLPSPLDRRARHVITEHARVLAAVAAMRAGDVTTLGALWLESHASMRDDYEISLPEIDQLVEIAIRQPGVHGARLTGGGFGGAVIALCETSTAVATAQRIQREYIATTRRPGRVLLPTEGPRVLRS